MGCFFFIDLLSYDVFFRDTSCVLLLDSKLLSTIDNILLNHVPEHNKNCIDILIILM